MAVMTYRIRTGFFPVLLPFFFYRAETVFHKAFAGVNEWILSGQAFVPPGRKHPGRH
jgi:hypothetical protein